MVQDNKSLVIDGTALGFKAGKQNTNFAPKLLASAEHMLLEGIVSKRRNSVYRSGECRDWVKIKTESWRAANRERWRLFERGRM